MDMAYFIISNVKGYFISESYNINISLKNEVFAMFKMIDCQYSLNHKLFRALLLFHAIRLKIKFKETNLNNNNNSKSKYKNNGSSTALVIHVCDVYCAIIQQQLLAY